MKKFFVLGMALILGISMISFMGCDNLKKGFNSANDSSSLETKGKGKGGFDTDVVPPEPGTQKDAEQPIQKQAEPPVQKQNDEPIQKQAEPPVQKQNDEPIQKQMDPLAPKKGDEPIQKQTDLPIQKQNDEPAKTTSQK